LQKLGKNFAHLKSGAPWSARSFWNIFQKEFPIEILWKNHNIIWDETRHVSAQIDEYSVRKLSKSFIQKRTFFSVVAMMNKKFITNLVERIWGSNLATSQYTQ